MFGRRPCFGYLVRRDGGQGASLALEDAIVFAKCLRDLSTTGEAFAIYQRLRQPRAEQMVACAQQIHKHRRISTNPLAVHLRDAIVPFFLNEAASDTTNQWIYDYHVDWHAPSPTAASAAATEPNESNGESTPTATVETGRQWHASSWPARAGSPAPVPAAGKEQPQAGNRRPSKPQEAEVPVSVLYMSMSLDGYIADPSDFLGGEDGNRLHEWFAPGGESGRPTGPAGELIDELNATGAVVTGRRTAELMDH